MPRKIVECVPNISEGRDIAKIDAIVKPICSIDGVKLLSVESDADYNRTVITFAGEPEGTLAAAVALTRKAYEMIDMTKHHGEHPRMGATDVCPLVPVANITMEETVGYARKLAKRIGEELKIPVYCYEHAAFSQERRNLAVIRAGEYEGLKDKLADPRWKPDFGPAAFNPKTGATVVGARDFLVAYNINLNTTSTRRANAVAFDVRERGRVKREGDPITGKIVRDKAGNPVMIPGTLKSVKAIGWYIEEYGIAQISMNLTNLSVTPVHIAFDEVCRRAEARGLRVTGSELVGLIPLKAMLDAGRYFLKKQRRSLGVPDSELIRIAVLSMGLNDLYEFKPEEKIIEYVLAGKPEKRLVDMTLEDFMNETASESPAPGGGSVAAYIGALGTALGTMVANLSSHKRGWDDRWEVFSDWAVKGKEIQNELLRLVDEDTRAFNRIMEAYGLPKKSEDEKKMRQQAIRDATLQAMNVPLQVMRTAARAPEVLEAMVKTGNPNSLSDAGVGALAIRTATEGAFMNVKINSAGLEEDLQAGKMLKEASRLKKNVLEDCDRILREVYASL